MSFFSASVEEAVHLFYPHICCACGNDALAKEQLLCYTCIMDLPKTDFADKPENPVEKIFTGRIKLEAAHGELYFSKGRITQTLIHQLKYKGNREIGIYLGQLLGESLTSSHRFSDIDLIVPLPMFPDKEYKRGYNQATIIANGISITMKKVINDKIVRRNRKTETQTKKHRAERWLNVDGSFIIKNRNELADKHVLLVDDVITTGATLEACGNAILEIPGTRLSIASLALAGN